MPPSPLKERITIMETGKYIYTPRFCRVKIKEIFDSPREAMEAGYTEPTHYHKDGWTVLGKSLDMYHMEFAAVNEVTP